MQTLYISDDQNASLFFNDHFFEIKLKGKVEDKIYKRINRKLLKLVKEKGCYKIIYDFEKLEHSDVISRAWYSCLFVPELFNRHGSSFTFAIVKSKNTFENRNAEIMFQTNARCGQKGELRYFNSTLDAESWISSS